MHLYEVHSYEGAQPGWHRTLGEAHADAKLSSSRDDVSITLRDYPSDQATICGLFNGIFPSGKELRRWKLTPRGGLREVPVSGKEQEPEHQAFAERALDYEAPPQNIGEAADAFWARLTTPKEK